MEPNFRRFDVTDAEGYHLKANYGFIFALEGKSLITIHGLRVSPLSTTAGETERPLIRQFSAGNSANQLIREPFGRASMLIESIDATTDRRYAVCHNVSRRSA